MKIAQVVGPIIPLRPDLIDTPYSIPAIAQMITDELVARGHSVTVFAPSDSVTPAHIAPGLTSSRFLKQHRLWSSHAKSKSRYLAIANHHFMSAIRASDEFDVIHNHELSLLYFAKPARCPIITTLHYHVPHIRPDILAVMRHYWFVAISRRQTVNFPQLKYAGVIHHGIAPEHYEFNANPKGYLAWLGRVTQIKGTQEAIMAALGAGVPIHLGGNIEKKELTRPYTREVKALIRKNPKLVSYLGKVGHRRKIALLKNARAVLMPIRWEEPFGLVAIEAFACGTPVIGFKRGALPEIIEDGKTGFIVSTVPQMIRAIKKIPTIDRSACRRAVETYFNIKRMTDDYEKLYAKISRKK